MVYLALMVQNWKARRERRVMAALAAAEYPLSTHGVTLATGMHRIAVKATLAELVSLGLVGTFKREGGSGLPGPSYQTGYLWLAKRYHDHDGRVEPEEST